MNPNEKGQVVIPKEIRAKLGIGPDTPLNIVLRDSGFYVYPVKGLISQTKTENSYLKILEKTRGAWVGSETEDVGKRKRLEFAAAKRRRKTW